MIQFKFIMLIAALCSFTYGCAGDNSESTIPPAKDKTAIELRQISATDNSVDVEVTLANADIAYCRLYEADAATPSLSALRGGRSLTESGMVTFDGLASGYTYKIYGVAGRNSVYTNVVGIEVKTSGEIDYNFPEGGASVSVTVQRAAFATGVPPNIYAFHRYTRNSTYLSDTLAKQFPMQSRG